MNLEKCFISIFCAWAVIFFYVQDHWTARSSFYQCALYKVNFFYGFAHRIGSKFDWPFYLPYALRNTEKISGINPYSKTKKVSIYSASRVGPVHPVRSIDLTLEMFLFFPICITTIRVHSNVLSCLLLYPPHFAFAAAKLVTDLGSFRLSTIHTFSVGY